MEHLNSGCLKLGLVAPAFGSISTIRRRDLARPMSEGEFRQSLEQIWVKGS